MNISVLKNIYNDQKGSPAVELALIFPIFLLMMVGALDYGSAFVRKMQLTEVVKSGVQYAMVAQPTYNDFIDEEGNAGTGADVTEIKSRINTNLGTSGNGTTTVKVEYVCICDTTPYDCEIATCGVDQITNTFIKVSISEVYETPFFNYSWFGVNFPIYTEATIRVNKIAAVPL